jgi:hypothetical protein
LSGNLVEGVLAVFATDAAYKVEVLSEFKALAKDDPFVRAGQYAALAGSALSRSPAAAKAAGELGMFMEEVAVTRVGALACAIVSAPELELVGQLDSLFALAVAGVRIEVPDFMGAASFIDKLLKRAVGQAVERAPAEPVCGAVLGARFKDHLSQWQEFYLGTHPWAMGCSVTVNEKEFLLKCV